MYVEIDINYTAVFVAAFLYIIIGLFWYSPFGFEKQWMKLVRLNKQQIQSMRSKGMVKSYLLKGLTAFLTAYILAHFIDFTGAKTISDGMQTGFWLWLGFVATTSLPSFLYYRKPFKLYFLDNGYHLVSFIMMGAILAIWI